MRLDTMDAQVDDASVLADSHLSIHTCPELASANVDLLSYGDVDGGRVLDVVYERLGAHSACRSRVTRTVG